MTGVAGFIGSNLLQALLEPGPAGGRAGQFLHRQPANLDDVRAAVAPEAWERFTFIEGDIRSLEDCRRACEGAEVVLHQAALGSVPRSIKDPIGTHQSNVDGFLNMLVAGRDAGVCRFVYAVLQRRLRRPPGPAQGEDRIGQPLSPYAVTKVVNELYAKVFGRAYGMETIGLRYFNVFGRRQDPDGPYAAVIPLGSHRMLTGQNAPSTAMAKPAGISASCKRGPGQPPGRPRAGRGRRRGVQRGLRRAHHPDPAVPG